MHRPENIERQEEKESCGEKRKLKRHFMVEFRLIKDIGDNSRVITIAIRLCKQKELSYRANSKESAITTAGCTRERVLYCRITRSDTIKREIKKIATSSCSF